MQRNDEAYFLRMLRNALSLDDSSDEDFSETAEDWEEVVVSIDLVEFARE
jgi:hypothetical protein